MNPDAFQVRTLIASLLALTLLALSFDAEAGRRSLRIEFEQFGWSAAQELGLPDCPGSSESGTIVYWDVFNFTRGTLAGGNVNVEDYCQDSIPYDSDNPDDPYFRSTYSFNGADDAGIAQKVGENSNNAWSARVYSYMDRDRFDEDVQGFQWEFYFRGSVTLVRLNGNVSGSPEVARGSDGTIIWDSSAFYDGQFFCFDDGEYIGIWDGSSSGSSALAGCEMPPPAECFELILDKVGNGDLPSVSPESTVGCPAGQYKDGEVLTLTARPDEGYKVSRWCFFDFDCTTQYNLVLYWEFYPYYGEGYVLPGEVAVYYEDALTCPSKTAALSWLAEDMEDGAGGWTHSATVGSDTWALQDADAVSPTQAWNGRASAESSDQRLVSPPVNIPLDASNVILSYYHQRDFSSGYCDDGAILEYSTDGGSNWVWMTENFLLDSPPSTIRWPTGYPASDGDDGWCGEFNALGSYFVPWRLTEVDVSDLAGETVNFRFRIGTDAVGPETGGWWIDDVTVAGCMPEDVILRDGFE